MFDLGSLLGTWFRGKKNRFDHGPAGSQEVINPFDIPTELINDMIARGIQPWHVETIDLSVAGSREIMVPGFHFVMYGHDNSETKMVDTQAFIEVQWGPNKGNQAVKFPMKHARGLSGPFQSLYITWPAQSGVFADVVVHTLMHTPWIDGEAAT